jgi:fibronectin type 3 domain-containing protein
MRTTNYRRALYEAKQDLARCLVQRQKIDRKVARLQGVITQLQDLCAERDRKHFESSIDRVVKAHLNMGITELSRVILKEKFFPLTAGQIKQELEARKLDLSRYSNPLAVIHTVLKRLVQGGDVKIVPQERGKKAYQWVSTTDKLLSELRQSSPVQQGNGLKEPK